MASDGATGGVESDFTGYEESSSSTDQDPSNQSQSTSSDYLSGQKSLDTHDGVPMTVEESAQDKVTDAEETLDTATVNLAAEIVKSRDPENDALVDLQFKSPTLTNVNFHESNTGDSKRKTKDIIMSPIEEGHATRFSQKGEKHIAGAHSIIRHDPLTQRYSEKDNQRPAQEIQSDMPEIEKLMRAIYLKLTEKSSEGDCPSSSNRHGVLAWVVESSTGSNVHRSSTFQTPDAALSLRAKMYLKGCGQGRDSHISLILSRLNHKEEDVTCTVKVQVLNHMNIEKTKEYSDTFTLSHKKNSIEIAKLIEICVAKDEKLGYSLNGVLVVVITVEECS